MKFLPKNIKTSVKIAQNLAILGKNLLLELKLSSKNAILISDEDIWQNCSGFFEDNFCEKKLILEKPKADEENLEIIAKNLNSSDLIIAVGSGTISDLCKYTSFKTGIPYVIFPSAASMNGYLSKNASITVNSHKKTLAATLPEAIFCDIEILKNAPKILTKAGIGDSMCFYSCWFDWLLSHLLLETEFNHESFALLSDEMSDFINNYKNFSDNELLEILMKILLLSGASMTLAGSSSPASQSEHLIAHAYSMKYPLQSAQVLHGLQIASTTLISAKIQEELISSNEISMRENSFEFDKISKFFGAKIAKECEKEYSLKHHLIRQNQKFLSQELHQNWQQYCQVLSRVFLSEQTLRDIFYHFKIDVGNEALRIDKGELDELVYYAKFIRNRFTCLDF
jgi:glycerol-1-phosphate dehydrogenase [NAD(P)+]